MQFFENSLEGQSLYVPSGSDLTLIPAPHKDFLEDQHYEFLKNPGSYYENKLGEIKLISMKKWFESMLVDGRFGMIIHFSNLYGNMQNKITMRGYLKECNSWRNFQLPVSTPYVDSLPYPLNDFYSLSNGIIEGNDAFYSSRFDELYSLSFDHSSANPDLNYDVINWDKTLVFYNHITGDNLISYENQAYHLSHENYSVHKIGTLEEVIDSYFLADLNSETWNPFPSSGKSFSE